MCVCVVKMSKEGVIVFVANGSEEIEALGTVDVLRRAGLKVTVTSVHDTTEILMSRGVRVVADTTISALLRDAPGHMYQAVVVPGGMPGASNIASCKAAEELTLAHQKAGAVVAAICAAPAVAFLPWGLLDGEGMRATCHPGFEERLREKGVFAEGDRVVVFKNIVTSRGPGTAIEFALAIVEQLCGKEAASKVAGPMLPLLP